MDHNERSAEENCESCVKELSRFIEMIPFENSEQFSQIQQSQQKTIDPKNKLKNQNFFPAFDSFSFNRQFNNISLATQPENQEISLNQNFKRNLTLKDLTKVILKKIDFCFKEVWFIKKIVCFKTLLEKNEDKLPLFYQQQETDELLEGNSSLQEFVVGCLLDPNFPNFVKQVESILTDILKSEENQT